MAMTYLIETAEEIEVRGSVAKFSKRFMPYINKNVVCNQTAFLQRIIN